MDKRILATIAFVLFLAIPLTSGTAFATWGSNAHGQCVNLTFQNSNGVVDGINPLINISHIAGMVGDGTDFLLTNDACNGNPTANLSFYFVTGANGSEYSIIPNITNISGANAKFGLYFNETVPSNRSNGATTFPMFEDRSRTIVNTSVWSPNLAGNQSVDNGYLIVGNTLPSVIDTFATVPENYSVYINWRQNSSLLINQFGWATNGCANPDYSDCGTETWIQFHRTGSIFMYGDNTAAQDIGTWSGNTLFRWLEIWRNSTTNVIFQWNGSTPKYQNTSLPTGALAFGIHRYTIGGDPTTPLEVNLTYVRKRVPIPFVIGQDSGQFRPSLHPAPSGIVINITLPGNTTYYGNNTVDAQFLATANVTTFNLSAYLDGTLIYESLSYSNNTQINLTLNTTEGRQYNFTVNGSMSGNTSTSSLFFYIFKGLNISVFDPAGNAITGWNLTSSNSTNQINLTGFDNGQSFEWVNLTGGSSTITISASGYDTRTLNLSISSSMDFTQHNFTLYRLNYFQAISTFSNATITPLRLNFTNTSFYLQVNGTTSPVIISSRNLFLGANTITGFVSGYSAQSVAFTFNTTNFANITFNLSPVAFQMRVLDEDIRNVLTAWDATFVNIDNNNTELDIAFNNSLPGACRDGSISTICRSVGQANVSNVGIIGIGLNSVTFLVGFQCPSGGDNVILQIRDINGNNATIFDSDPDAGGCNGAIQSSTVVVNNINGSYPRFINVTMVSTSAANITEFDLTDASPYTYAADNQSATILFENFTSSTLNLFIQGAEGMNDGAGLYTDTAARMYRLTQLPPSTNFSFTGYLLKDEGINYLQAWTIQNLLEQPLSDALITLSRFYPSGSTSVETTVAQCISNPAGSCTIFLKPNQIYSFRVALTGYNTLYNQSVTFTTTPNPALIILQQSGAGNITTIRDGITFELDYPDIYNTAAPINVSCTVSNSHGSTNYVEFNITRYLINGTSAFYARSFSNSAPTGIGFTIQLNDTGRYALLCTHQWTANTTVTAPQVYTNNLRQELWIATDSLHNVGLDLFGAGDAENPNILIITSFILLITAILIVNFAGFGAGGIIVLIVAGILVWLGLLSLLIFLALILTFMAIYILRGGL